MGRRVKVGRRVSRAAIRVFQLAVERKDVVIGSRVGSWSALVLLLVSCADPEATSSPDSDVADGASPRALPEEAVPTVSEETIQWLALEPTTFEAARQRDRLVLLFITAPWSGADSLATTDPALEALVEDRFIPVRLDPLRRPDIARRYAPAGWPALAVTLPDGRPVAIATDIPDANIHGYLLSLANHFRDRRGEVTKRVATSWASSPKGSSVRTGVSIAVESLYEGIVADHDSVHGGFGSGAKFPETRVLRFLLSYHESHGDTKALSIAMQGLSRLYSAPMWDEQAGGVQSYSFTPDWLSPIREKDAADQAGLLEALLQVEQLTDEASIAPTARLLTYIRAELFDVERGVFFGRQVGGRPGVDPTWWTDPTVYTDRNALLILACLRAARAETEGPESEDMALAAATYMMEEGMRPDGAVYHCVTESGPQLPGLLDNQMLAALALWDAYQLSAREEFASAARQIVRWTEANLYDHEIGAFVDSPEDSPIPTWRPMMKFADETVPAGNASAARLYLQMGEGEVMASRLLSSRLFDPAVPKRAYASYGRALLQQREAVR